MGGSQILSILSSSFSFQFKTFICFPFVLQGITSTWMLYVENLKTLQECLVISQALLRHTARLTSSITCMALDWVSCACWWNRIGAYGKRYCGVSLAFLATILLLPVFLNCNCAFLVSVMRSPLCICQFP